MSAWLIDTGPLVALIDEADEHHARVLPVFQELPALLWTTAPVIIETMLFLQESPEACSALVEFLRTTRIRIEPVSSLEDLDACVELMAKYRNIPMDFADASLVLLSEKTGVADILTIDARGFRVFRINGRHAFHLVLDDFPG